MHLTRAYYKNLLLGKIFELYRQSCLNITLQAGEGKRRGAELGFFAMRICSRKPQRTPSFRDEKLNSVQSRLLTIVWVNIPTRNPLRDGKSIRARILFGLLDCRHYHLAVCPSTDT